MERRLANMGNDRSHWPAVAREAITKLETKQQVRMPRVAHSNTILLR